tara:strand:+ start:1730 stop:2839 length:1110 start_codon:yes stop_codon:yes gene_type:complete
MSAAGRVAALAKHYDAIVDDADDAIVPMMASGRGWCSRVTSDFEEGFPSTSSSSRASSSSTHNKSVISSFAMGCAVSLAAFGVATTAIMGKDSGATMMSTTLSSPGKRTTTLTNGQEHFSYPLNSDRSTYTGKSNEKYFDGEKHEMMAWRNGLIDVASVPNEKTNWVMNHPKIQAMMSASLGKARQLPQLGKSKTNSKKNKNKEEELDFDIPDGNKLPEHVEPVEMSSSKGMPSTKKVRGKVVTLDENGNINTAPMGRTTVDNYRMSWAKEHVVFTNGDYSANYIPMKERDWKKKFRQIPGQGLMKPKDSMMTVDDAGTLIGRRKMPASQLGEVEKDDDDNEIIHKSSKKEASSHDTKHSSSKSHRRGG